jgi:hypothetical protein
MIFFLVDNEEEYQRLTTRHTISTLFPHYDLDYDQRQVENNGNG